MPNLRQSPPTGAALITHTGDTLTLRLTVTPEARGSAWVRTNLGNASIRRRQIIALADQATPNLHQDWRDLRMPDAPDGHYTLVLPLAEVGQFSAKAFFLPEGATEPVWPEGPNVTVKVEPAAYQSANTIYSAFVRLFGPQRQAETLREQHSPTPLAALDAAGYTVIPPSGTFRELISELDHIFGTLRFRILQLLPIHPTPTTYARMGRFGSPFASQDFEEVDPALADFDRRTTPLDQFKELADAVHARQGRLFLDLPINHTGWASRLQIHHPEWFARNDDDTFKSPGAWGVTWEDLSKLDYRHQGLWRHMAEIFLYWCSQGVDGFRCDAGYKVPAPVWAYITARVREIYPETLFMLEGLGGKLEDVNHLLTFANLDWAYSELFQNYSRQEIERYLPGCLHDSNHHGTLVHFAETHDNNRLAATSTTFARMRTAMAALFCDSGAFGIANGVEWFATEKIDVHNLSGLNWGSPENQVAFISRLNTLLANHPCFLPGTRLRLIHQSHTEACLLLREHPTSGRKLLIAINLDIHQPTHVNWARTDFDPPADTLTDLITDQPIPLPTPTDPHHPWIELTPGQTLCLSPDPPEIPATAAPNHPHLLHQRAKAKVLELAGAFPGNRPLMPADLDAQANALLNTPAASCRAWAPDGAPHIVLWEWPQDLRRTVMIPLDHVLLLTAPDPFRLDLLDDQDQVLRREESLPTAHGTHVCPIPHTATQPRTAATRMRLSRYHQGLADHALASLRFLPTPGLAQALTRFDAPAIKAGNIYAIRSNAANTMVQAHADWAALHSQYDAFLAANLHPLAPEDRRVMLTRCRAWLVYRSYSQDIGLPCLTRFDTSAPDALQWQFDAPTGMGLTTPLTITLRLAPNTNAITLTFSRAKAALNRHLADALPVHLIVRPDIEDRSHHEKTKAYTGPEQQWSATIQPRPDGFTFTPAPNRLLRLHTNAGAFVPEPEWQYLIPHPVEAARGLDGHSDLFSPGYFRFDLQGGHEVTLSAAVNPSTHQPPTPPSLPPTAASPTNAAETLQPALLTAMRAYFVRRDQRWTLIAGFPWFLDWGRDTLICLRGIIAANWIEEAADILLQFARFEDRGTLPNVMIGTTVSNRDTSDAPLWFCVACHDLIRRAGHPGFLDRDCGGRTVRDVVRSIVQHYRQGTPNGIHMDRDSALIFSPAHFTWMDTNYPAGTPREGYPIEIQALWQAALHLAALAAPEDDWETLHQQARTSILSLYSRPTAGLIDCLHARPHTPAATAEPDDAIRPNQLLALTLGAITDRDTALRSLDACSRLLVPGAIRSLADLPVQHPLPIHHDGHPLNDPNNPYWGAYRGDEDHRRKPAYHNGTAWTWLFPSYSEALLLLYGTPAIPTARALLESSTEILNRDCAGQIPEILDGDSPHQGRGCGAQAWGVTELYRILALLTEMT